MIVINDALTPAVGTVAHLSGWVLDAKGSPVRNAEIEIWEVDNTGVYLKDRPNQRAFDTHFQGFGRFVTGSTGDYYFRTLKSIPYPGRTAPHIHFKVKLKGREAWTTQCYIKGHPGNARDFVYRGIGDAKAQSRVTVDFTPLNTSRIGEVAARFDIILGMTPMEKEGKK